MRALALRHGHGPKKIGSHEKVHHGEAAVEVDLKAISLALKRLQEASIALLWVGEQLEELKQAESGSQAFLIKEITLGMNDEIGCLLDQPWLKEGGEA